jgi:hypothetical protein
MKRKVSKIPVKITVIKKKIENNKKLGKMKKC